MSRVLISMPDQFLADIDAVAESEERTRSELIREALRSYMKKQQEYTSNPIRKNYVVPTRSFKNGKEN